jgi:hypothetical protein
MRWLSVKERGTNLDVTSTQSVLITPMSGQTADFTVDRGRMSTSGRVWQTEMQ